MAETGNTSQGSVKFPSAELETNLDANSTAQMDRNDVHTQWTSFPTSRVPKKLSFGLIIEGHLQITHL
jgi:hypothetical protein